MIVFNNIARSIFIVSTIVGSSIMGNAQEVERVYNDAELHNLKGHVKECVEFNEEHDTISVINFEMNGRISVDENSFISRDEMGRIVKIFEAEIESIDADLTKFKEGETINENDFTWDGATLIPKEKVSRILHESDIEEFSVMAQFTGTKYEWKDNKVVAIESVIPGGTYIWTKISDKFLCHGTGWWETTSFKYDKKGNIIKSETQYKTSKKVETYKYLEFDSHGNWTKCQINDGNGDSWITTRNITYFE